MGCGNSTEVVKQEETSSSVPYSESRRATLISDNGNYVNQNIVDDVTFKRFQIELSEVQQDENGAVLIQQAMNILNRYYTSTEDLETYKEMCRLYSNTDPDTKIDPDEFNEFFRRTRDRNIRMDNLFRKFDADSNGTLDEQELRDHLAVMYKIDPEMISSIMTVYDDDENRVIDKQEFLTLMTILEEEPPIS